MCSPILFLTTQEYLFLLFCCQVPWTLKRSHIRYYLRRGLQCRVRSQSSSRSGTYGWLRKDVQSGWTLMLFYVLALCVRFCCPSQHIYSDLFLRYNNQRTCHWLLWWIIGTSLQPLINAFNAQMHSIVSWSYLLHGSRKHHLMINFEVLGTDGIHKNFLLTPIIEIRGLQVVPYLFIEDVYFEGNSSSHNLFHQNKPPII